MRQLSEIKKDIEEINRQINTLKAQLRILNNERKEHIFADFCDKYGVKKGDVVHTDRYGDMMVCGVDKRWDNWIQVRKIKKNGEPYSVINTQLPDMFEGCKVIGHIDNEESEQNA